MKTNKKIVYEMIIISALFLSLIGYLTYFELFQKEKIVANSYNSRQWEKEDNTLRGRIFDRNGTVLAKSTINEGKQQREYPYRALYSHVIGYSSRTYGKSLLELKYNKYLLNNLGGINNVFNISERIKGANKVGNDIYLSIDNDLQLLADKLLDGKNGAIVVMNPKTGEVLSMVSKPDFDPNNEKLIENWSHLVESDNSPFLARATQGLYAPGSTYKVVTSIAAIEEGMENRTFNDKGYVVIDGRKITNFGGKAYGTIDLKSALAVSSNCVFSQLGVDLGDNKIKEVSKRVGISKEVPFDIPVSKSLFPYDKMSRTDMAAVAIGQGKLLVTPLQMAMITSGIANNGLMMKPTLVSKIVSPNENILNSYKPDLLYKIIETENAKVLHSMMKEVIESGTGKNASIEGIKVAGKTGTAENEQTIKGKKKEHAWFIGFAPVEDPKVAVAIIIEYSGSTGGTIAAPIAKKLMLSYLDKVR